MLCRADTQVAGVGGAETPVAGVGRLVGGWWGPWCARPLPQTALQADAAVCCHLLGAGGTAPQHKLSIRPKMGINVAILELLLLHICFKYSG